MAVFGAPATLEDHAIRGCLAGLKIQDEGRSGSPTTSSSATASSCRLRVGLNSGEVIAGEIGSGTFGYTTIGEQVGMAQRMESVAPPGGIMLDGSTARLVDSVALLGEPEMVHIKGAGSSCARAPPARHGRPASQRSGVQRRVLLVGGGKCQPSRACGPCHRRPRRRARGGGAGGYW